MLAHRRDVAPAAGFVVGRAERLPFAARAFDLVTAAGSINYADLGLFLPEVARVLSPGGALVVYDFSAARRSLGDRGLEDWFTAFEARYPFPSGYELDVRVLPYAEAGLRFAGMEEFEVVLPMTPAAYLAYALSETNVELAVSRGAAEEDIRAWCRQTLDGVFAGATREIVFEAYAAYVVRG